ncbi:MAG: DUF962 domain-containing protein [Ferruginibacter sp.]
MRTISDWLSAYWESHKTETNKLIHWICVPAIVFSILGMLHVIKLPFYLGVYQLNVGLLVSLVALLYYFLLSASLSIGMFLYLAVCMLIANLIERSGMVPLWLFSIIIFALAWAGQFYGHKIEGKKPSFLKDIQFLMIGPAWLMSFIYKKIGVTL